MAICSTGFYNEVAVGARCLRREGTVDVDDMILVSIDDHVIEPRDMFDHHVPAKYKSLAPKSVLNDEGIERWQFMGAESGSGSLNAVVGWPKEEWGMNPTTYAEMRPGAYDIHDRVRDMNHNGILASMCFPSFVGFSGGFFQRSDDKDLALVMTQAYNDWHIDEWAASYPGRFIPLAIPPVWDPDALANEVRRVAKKGCHAMTMPELPHIQGLPSYHDVEYWDPFWRACSEEQVVMCLHIGQGFAAINSAPDAPIDNLIILATQVSTLAAQDLLWGPGIPELPRPQGGVVRGGYRVDSFLPEPLRSPLHEPTVAGSRLWRQVAERHLP